jgi:cytosine/adenosine deaminase-related metal-dependent hydrolase
MQIYRAKHLLLMDAPPIADGAVAVDGERIVAVGAAREVRAAHAGELRDLGEAVLLPGLINAHCHLDYTHMAGQVEWRGVFIDWIARITELKRQLSDDACLAAITDGIERLARSGTTSILNIESFPRLIQRVAAPAPRLWWCPELIDLLEKRAPDEILGETLDLVESLQARGYRCGLSPHAPYTVSPQLYRLAAQQAQVRNLLLTTHLAESAEEDDMFRKGLGPMFEHYRRRGRDMSDCRHHGPVQLAAELGVLGPNCLAAHVNFLTPPELDLLRQSGTHVVHCPRAHQFFRRGCPPLNLLWENGVNLCLGTDSMASNEGLDMFAEMQTMARVFPRLAPARILEMATCNGAKALNCADQLGRLAPGGFADLVAVPLDGQTDDPFEAVVFNEKPVTLVMVGGRLIVNEYI